MTKISLSFPSYIQYKASSLGLPNMLTYHILIALHRAQFAGTFGFLFACHCGSYRGVGGVANIHLQHIPFNKRINEFVCCLIS